MHPLAELLKTNVCAASNSQGSRTMWRHRHVGALVTTVDFKLACLRLDFLIFSPRLRVCLFPFAAPRSTELVAGSVDPIVVFMPEICVLIWAERCAWGCGRPFSMRIANGRAYVSSTAESVPCWSAIVIDTNVCGEIAHERDGVHRTRRKGRNSRWDRNCKRSSRRTLRRR